MAQLKVWISSSSLRERVELLQCGLRAREEDDWGAPVGSDMTTTKEEPNAGGDMDEGASGQAARGLCQ